MWSKFLPVLFVISLFFIGIVAGSVLTLYELPPSQLVSRAIQWKEAWEKVHKAPKKTKLSRKEPRNKPVPPAIYWNKSKAYNGYTLLSKMHAPGVLLIDMRGEVVHSWHIPLLQVWPDPKQILNRSRLKYYMHKVHVFPNGDLLAQYTARRNTPYGVGIAKFDKDSKLIWQYSENAHHDFYIDKHNANIYALTQKMVLDAPKGYENLLFPMLVEYVVKLSPQGTELKKVSVLEAFMNSNFRSALYLKRTITKNNIWDHFHINSVMKLEPELAGKFPAFKAGQVLISIRNPSTLAVIDMDTERVVWTMQGDWKMQHDAQFQPDGTIALFDNQGTGKRFSRVLFLDPESGKIVRENSLKDNKHFFSPFMSRVQTLKNGNILIVSTAQRNAFEITSTGDLVWNYKYSPYNGGVLVDAQRYASEEVPFLVKKFHVQ